jgi:hypothetical protein
MQTYPMRPEAIFRLKDNYGNVIGILAIHVDDTIGGGTEQCHMLVDAVARDLKVGSKEEQNFHYKGLRVSTIWKDDIFEIVVDGDEYLDSAIAMTIPGGLTEDTVLAPQSATDFRPVAGTIGYVASAFRPDLSLEASLLGRVFSTPTVRDARKANSILEWAKNNRYNLQFRRGATCLTAFSDSAGPNGAGTQGGRLFALTDYSSHYVVGWILWESRKLKRVCRSTATGETLSLGASHDTAMWLSKVWFELTQPEGFATPENIDKVCRLRKAFHALKQANRQWSAKMDTFLCGELGSFEMLPITVSTCGSREGRSR